MPTINEVWEQALQINANLATVHNDLTDLKGCCRGTNEQLTNLIARTDETNDWLEELRQVATDGFAVIAAGISGIHARQDFTNRLLVLQIEHQQAMICILENISRNTCLLLNESSQQTELQTSLAENAGRLNHMYASSNPEAALAYSRHKEEHKLLEECCPPEPREPSCTYEPCPVPGQAKIDQFEQYAGYVAKSSKVVRTKDKDNTE